MELTPTYQPTLAAMLRIVIQSFLARSGLVAERFQNLVGWKKVGPLAQLSSSS